MNSILDRRTRITSRSEYLALAKLHHPDNGGSEQAMAHVNALYSDTPPNHLRIGSINYIYTSHFQNTFIGTNSVLFRTPPSVPTPDLTFKFPDEKVKTEMQKYLPVFVRQETDFCVVGKPTTQYSLRQYLPHFTASPHASWIISSLYNLLCYLEWAQLTHNAISIDNIFFDPELHSAHLLGGWWFSKPLKAPLTHLPSDTVSINPRLAKTKVASHLFDLTLIKRLGLELMGDRTGMSLDRQNPKFGFLRSPSTGSARADYALWMKTLGERKFIQLTIPKESK